MLAGSAPRDRAIRRRCEHVRDVKERERKKVALLLTEKFVASPDANRWPFLRA